MRLFIAWSCRVHPPIPCGPLTSAGYLLLTVPRLLLRFSRHRRTTFMRHPIRCVRAANSKKIYFKTTKKCFFLKTRVVPLGQSGPVSTVSSNGDDPRLLVIVSYVILCNTRCGVYVIVWSEYLHRSIYHVNASPMSN